jgi:hypothetical protein
VQKYAALFAAALADRSRLNSVADSLSRAG